MPIVSEGSRFVGASPPWRQAIREAVRSGAELCRRLDLPESLASSAAAELFPVFAPQSYIGRMRPGDPADPLLRQVLPVGEETGDSPGFVADPVGDRQALAARGLIKKYRDRVLLVVTGVCAVHCRYCFRRHFPYADDAAGDLQAALEQIGRDEQVREVVLSGGDPLTLSDSRLAELADQLQQIPHLRRLRVHTRLPIVIPQRVTDELLDGLRAGRLATWLVVHANHANEIDGPTGAALERLVDAGVPVLNQSVLLRGVNDNLEALCQLSERLVERRVTPYYLHQLDKVAGAAHFDTEPSLGVRLIEGMRARLPGYAVPRLVREVAGEPNKQVLA